MRLDFLDPAYHVMVEFHYINIKKGYFIGLEDTLLWVVSSFENIYASLFWAQFYM